MYKNNVEIVVARYNENLFWLNEFPFNQFEYIVYNKGDNDNFVKTNVKEIIKLPNVGRCDHTYLYHIVSNYNNLSNIVVFFPGCIDMENKKEKAKDILNRIINSSYNTAFFIGEFSANIRAKFYGFKLDEWKSTTSQNFNKNSESSLNLCKIRPYQNWYSYFFGNTPARWNTYWGIFSIDKRDIIQHPITRYYNLIETVNKHSNPEAGHYIERSWGAIFYPLIYTCKVKY
jgi:hypothetical protein